MFEFLFLPVCFLFVPFVFIPFSLLSPSFIWLVAFFSIHIYIFFLHSPGNSTGQNTGLGTRSLLQGIFPTQGLNPYFLPCRQILYQLSHEGFFFFFPVFFLGFFSSFFFFNSSFVVSLLIFWCFVSSGDLSARVCAQLYLTLCNSMD